MVHLARGYVDRPQRPDLSRVDPRVPCSESPQGHVLAEVADGRVCPEVEDAIGKQGDPLVVFGRDLGVDVQLSAAIGTDMDVADSGDRSS
jgi:hypothetical protein